MGTRVDGIDGLRGIAIGLVLFTHLVGNEIAFGERGLFWAAASVGGWAGVDLFFVVSGFLVGGGLARKPTPALVFYRARAARLLPLLWIVVLSFHSLSDQIPTWVGLFMLTGWWQAFGLVPSSAQLVLWSLGVEEFFYALALPASRVNRDHLPTLLVGVALASTVLRWALVATEHIEAAYVLPLARLDGIAFGWWLALKQPARPGWAVPLATLVGMGLPLVFHQYGLGPIRAFMPSLMAGIGGAWLLWALENPAALTQPWLRWMGRRCYALYLLHVPLYLLLGGRVWLVVPVLVVLTELSWRYLEEPLIEAARPARPSSERR